MSVAAITRRESLAMGEPLANEGKRTAGWQPRGSKNDPLSGKSTAMNAVFDWCVDFLEWLAPIFGMSYKEINVWLFVIVMPGIILIQGIWCLYLWRRLKQQEAQWSRAAKGSP